MKKLLAVLMSVCLLTLCVCGCDTKTDSVSSESDTDSGSSNVPIYSKYTEKDYENYWQEYEGTPPANKKYVIYSSPLSGVKEGIANDPNSDVLAVRNATKLYFTFVNGCDIEQKPFTYFEMKEYTDDSLPYYKEVEFWGKKYEVMSNFKNNAITTTQKHTFNGQEYCFEVKYDKYCVFYEDNSLGIVTVRRDTGMVVEYEAYDFGKKPEDDIVPISQDEARAKMVQYVRELCGEDVIEDFKVESAEIEKGNFSYNAYLDYSIGEYNTCYSLQVGISFDGSLMNVLVRQIDALKAAVEEYGKEAFDKAKAVLESAVEIPDNAGFYITFDSDGRLFLVVTTNKSYPQLGPQCDGVHPMHYAVEILPIV